MITYDDWLSLVRQELKRIFSYSDKEIDTLFKEHKDVIISDYENRIKSIIEQPEWTCKADGSLGL